MVPVIGITLIAKGIEAIQMTGPGHFLVFIGQSIGNFKTEFLHAPVLSVVVDVHVKLHPLHPHALKQINDKEFLGFRAETLPPVFRQRDFEGHHGGASSLGPEPKMDGSDGRPLPQGDEVSFAYVVPEKAGCQLFQCLRFRKMLRRQIVAVGLPGIAPEDKQGQVFRFNLMAL